MNRRCPVGTGRLAVTIVVASGGRRDELALLRRGLGVKCDKHTESGECGDLHVSPPRRNSDRRIALSHTRYVALTLFCVCWHAAVCGSGFSVRISNVHSGGGDSSDNSTIRVSWRQRLLPRLPHQSHRPQLQRLPCFPPARQSARRCHRRSGHPPARGLAVHLHIQRVPMPSQLRPMFYAYLDSPQTTHHHRGPDIGQKPRCPEAEKYRKARGKDEPSRRGKPVTRRREPFEGSVTESRSEVAIVAGPLSIAHYGPGQKYTAVHTH